MPSASRLRWFLFMSCLLLAPFACGESPIVDGGGTDGTGGTGEQPFSCELLFGDACGTPCDSENACPDGMFCQAGKCNASCGEGFPCMNGLQCTSNGMCPSAIDEETDPECEARTCEEMDFACGVAVDDCGKVIDCADEGLSCSANEMCVGGLDSPTECVTANFLDDCDVCSGIADCSAAPQFTILSGRVVSPGRNDADVENQVGVPNALVYIVRNNDAADLPAMTTGLPSGGGDSCDRCEDQDVGPVLVGAVTDSSGHFELEGNVPVDTEFLLVVKAGKFRRAVPFTLPASAACETTSLPEGLPGNPTRLPRNKDDGVAVHIPHIAVATGAIDAMECVFRKMGLDVDEFSAPRGDGSVHLYRANGAWPPGSCFACAACGPGEATCRADNCNNGTTPCNAACRTAFLAACSAASLTANDGTLPDYDMAVFSCEGQGWDNNINRASHNVREYVNRGGRLFASHLSFTWLHEDADADHGDTPYDAATPHLTGLGPAVNWVSSAVTSPNSGSLRISFGRDNASPRLQGFADWMVQEGVIDDEDDTFSVIEPRSQVDNTSSNGLGPATEEFAYCSSGSNGCSNQRAQQVSFNTPYAAPDEAICGRVAYSGFHVSSGGDTTAFQNAIFPSHCEDEDLGNNGILTDQEKILLYMLFDVGACVGDDPPPPPCVPVSCPPQACGFAPNGCGGVIDCGTCTTPGPK